MVRSSIFFAIFSYVAGGRTDLTFLEQIRVSKSGFLNAFLEPSITTRYLDTALTCLSFSVSVSPECVSAFNELKLGKGTIKYIIFKLSDDYKQIVVEETSSDSDWEKFQSKLMNAKAGYKGKEGKGPRYAVYDFHYELEGGEGHRYVGSGLG